MNPPPVADVTGKEIMEIGIVVRDAVKTAKRYSEIFGIGPWAFFDLESRSFVYRETPISDGDSCLRVAMAQMGKLTIELLQPLYGRSSHRDFLVSGGEGIHHVSFGDFPDYDDVVGRLKSHGVNLEMSGNIDDAFAFSYAATQDTLGTIFELTKSINPDGMEKLNPWGSYNPTHPGTISLDGMEINQLGIVVEDVEKTAAAYWEIFGIGPWVFMDGKVGEQDGVLHGVTHTDRDTYIKIATAELKGMQFELLQPVSGTSSHMDFLKSRGQGIHHVSFGDVKDPGKMREAMGSNGIGIEMQGVLGNAITFTYFASQRDLGTIYEVLKTDPNIECTLAPTGIYPPQ